MGNGGIPSPILPDGTLISMPIPTTGSEIIKYADLNYDNKSYLEIVKDLNPRFPYTYCHLDPDIRKSITNQDDQWKSLFGQCGGAQGHLNKHLIEVGDIFLFFGCFRQTERDKTGKLRFVRNSPELHIIYGYMQIGEIVKEKNRIKKEFNWHPHSDEIHLEKVNNTIYVASDKLSLDNSLSGYGTFDLKTNRILTKPGMTRTKWDLPEYFKDVTITRHDKESFKEDHFQAVNIGQEFVIYAKDKIINWAMDIIKE